VSSVLDRFPPLDAGSPETATCAGIPFHRVPILDARKHEWVRHTPPRSTAFDNQCAACGFQGNPTHASTHEKGVHRTRKDTPVHCGRCGALLPRPNVVGPDGTPRIMHAFASAYRRMDADLPAPTLTRNLSYACSDHKLHPTQNRTLSLAEAFAVHSLDTYSYRWEFVDGSPAPDTLVRLALGESIPPRVTELIGRHILEIENGGRGSSTHDNIS